MKNFKNCLRINIIFAAIILLVAAELLLAQEKKKSPVYRSYETALAPLVLPSTLDLQLLEAFVLMQKANAGESPAQHELGLRYLLGRGFPADTPKSVFWIKKAANQKLPIAQFNLGILLMNGRGMEWNPFEAFKYFRAAAEQDNAEALYVIGLYYTENFVVQRDWLKSYQYFKKASTLGSDAANVAIKEMERRGLDKLIAARDTTPAKENLNKKKSQPTSKDTTFNLLFIDFHADTNSTINDSTLIREAYNGIEPLANKISADGVSSVQIDSNSQSLLIASAEAGNPEALCLLGRCFERGLNVNKNILLAGVYYLRALHFDSYRASALLWKLMNTDEFARELEMQSAKNNPNALYVWSGLFYSGFSKVLSERQSFELLGRASSAGHIPSTIELGSCYFAGRWVNQDRKKALVLWDQASALGSYEAQIRIAAATALGQTSRQDLNTALSILQNSAKEGSLFSDLTLAYCYEKGIGLAQNKGEAYRIFHKSLLRGSETAYNALRRMHDELRPNDTEFKLLDE